MKCPRTADYGVAASAASHTTHASRQASMYVDERSAATATMNAIAGGDSGSGWRGGFEEGAKEEAGSLIRV